MLGAEKPLRQKETFAKFSFSLCHSRLKLRE